MKRMILIFPALILLSACSNSGNSPLGGLIMWHEDEDKPAYTQTTSSRGAESRAPLDVPPELRAELEMPGQGQIATKADESILPKEYQEAVAGKAVSLNARVYKQQAAQVFSAAVDAMTSLNIPVASVDSPSGIVTSDWIRKGADNSGSIAGALGLGGGGLALTRHRFIVRVYRAKMETGDVTKLEIRVLGQSFENRHWANKPMRRKVSEEVFAAVEEQLTRMQQPTANP